jgi:hypothetical protein
MQARGVQDGDLSARASSIRWVGVNLQGQRQGVTFTTSRGEPCVWSTGSGMSAWRGPNRRGRTPWSCPAFVGTLAMRLVPVVGAVARSWLGCGSRVAALAVVEDLDEVEHRCPEALAGRPVVTVEELAFQKLSATALSSASPTVPIEATRPVSRSRRPKARLVYWPGSRGRGSTALLEQQ